MVTPTWANVDLVTYKNYRWERIKSKETKDCYAVKYLAIRPSNTNILLFSGESGRLQFSLENLHEKTLYNLKFQLEYREQLPFQRGEVRASLGEQARPLMRKDLSPKEPKDGEKAQLPRLELQPEGPPCNLQPYRSNGNPTGSLNLEFIGTPSDGKVIKVDYSIEGVYQVLVADSAPKGCYNQCRNFILEKL